MECSLDQTLRTLQGTVAILTKVQPKDLDGSGRAR
jgi:hypothetical protein